MNRTLLLLAVALVAPAVAHATTATATAQAELQAGSAAYQRGDYQQALADFRQLAAQGNAAAEFGLGGMYNDGQGVPQNYAEALKWYRLAAAQGVARAEFDLGGMYAEGQGVPEDYVNAYKWLLLAKAETSATDALYPRVTKGVRFLAAMMTPAQIAQAQQEASAWFAAHEPAGRVP